MSKKRYQGKSIKNSLRVFDFKLEKNSGIFGVETLKICFKIITILLALGSDLSFIMTMCHL